MWTSVALGGLWTVGLAPVHAKKAASSTVAPVQILGTGDWVAGLGRIGEAGIRVVGFDDHGRALISGYRNGRRPGLYWADGITVTPYWVPDDALIDALGAYQWDGLRFFVSGGGRVAAWGSLDSSITETVYRVESGSPVPIARAGDRDTQGATLGTIDAASINDNGVVAIGAEFTPLNWRCPDPEGDCYPPSGIYVVQDGALRRVVGEGDPSPWGAPFDSVQLVGLTRDNAVVFAAHTGGQGGGETHAVVADGTSLRHVLLGADSDFGLWRLRVLGSNAAGEVVFVALTGAPGVYRTDRGSVVQVTSFDALVPPGQSPDVYNAFLNTAGDVSIQLYWSPSYGGGVFLFPAAGGDPVLIGPADGYLNDRGDVEVSGDTVYRWHQGQLQPLVRNGDPVPGGGFFLSGGIGHSCLAPDGQVATYASAISNAVDYWPLLCGDSTGFHLVVERGDPTPEGKVFSNVGQCIFDDSGGLLFLGYELVPFDAHSSTEVIAGVYRATPAGLERVLGLDDTATDGSTLSGFGYPASLRAFASNTRGSVLATGNSIGRQPHGYDPEVFLRHRGGTLEKFWIDDVGALLGQSVVFMDMGLTDDDEVVVSVMPYDYFWGYGGACAGQGFGSTLLRWTSDGLQVVADRTALPGGPYDCLGRLIVRGSSIVFEARNMFDLNGRLFLYRTDTGKLEHVLTEGTAIGPIPPGRQIGVVDLTPAGSMLLTDWVFPNPSFFLRNPAGAISAIPPAVAPPIAINDFGTLLFGSSSTLSVQNPGPSGFRCPIRPPIMPLATPTPTPTTNSPLPSATPTRTQTPQSCTFDSDCPPPRICLNQVCSPGGVVCTTGAECTGDRACEGGFCAQLPRPGGGGAGWREGGDGCSMVQPATANGSLLWLLIPAALVAWRRRIGD